MRLLPERNHAVRHDVRRQEPQRDGGANPRLAERASLPVPLARPHGQSAGRLCQGEKSMKPQTLQRSGLSSAALAAVDEAGLSRRGFLKRTGALIVTFSAAGELAGLPAQELEFKPTPLNQVDS